MEAPPQRVGQLLEVGTSNASGRFWRGRLALNADVGLSAGPLEGGKIGAAGSLRNRGAVEGFGGAGKVTGAPAAVELRALGQVIVPRNEQFCGPRAIRVGPLPLAAHADALGGVLLALAEVPPVVRRGERHTVGAGVGVLDKCGQPIKLGEVITLHSDVSMMSATLNDSRHATYLFPQPGTDCCAPIAEALSRQNSASTLLELLSTEQKEARTPQG